MTADGSELAGITDPVTRCIAEAAAYLDRPVEAVIPRLISRPGTFKGTRMVYLLVAEDHPPMAMKIDLAQTGTDGDRLAREFALLTRLHTHMGETGRNRVPRPIHLSPEGQFHLISFVEGPTARTRIEEAKTPEEAGRAYRRSGEWLAAMHTLEPQGTAPIQLGWMLDNLDSLGSGLLPDMNEEVIAGYRASLAHDIARLNATEVTTALCHGDYHSANLIFTGDVNHGFDVTEAHRKATLFDAVDFLKLDILSSAPDEDIGPGGISRKMQDLFFRGYGAPFDPALLALCLRGRLLRDWLLITPEDYARSDWNKHRAHNSARRLARAFALPLDG